MDRITHYIIVTWQEDEATIQSLTRDDFEDMRRGMIDQGFGNLQVEWYESGSLELPDRILVFVYWDDPDKAPSYEQVREWGREVAKMHRT